jgi:hypothetical protein
MLRGYWTTTRWSFRGQQPADIEVVFVEPAEPSTGVLVIRADDPDGGRAGRYAFAPGYLDPRGWRELDGLRFRTCSLEGEWVNRLDAGAGVVAARNPDPKIVEDRDLLAALIPPATRAQLARRTGA